MPRRSRSFLSALNDALKERYGSDVPGFPRGMWVAGIAGSLVGIGLWGLETGFALGLPCLAFYNAIHGLLTGRITSAGSKWQWHLINHSTRRDDPMGYWSAVIFYFVIGIFLLSAIFP